MQFIVQEVLAHSIRRYRMLCLMLMGLRTVATPAERKDILMNEVLAELLTSREAAERLNVGITRMNELLNEGAVMGYKTRLGWLVEPKSVDAYKQARPAMLKRQAWNRRWE